MRMLRKLPRLLVGMLLLQLVIVQPALAEVLCVETAVGLRNALTTAASNGQDNEVRIVQGTYVGNFVYPSTQVNRLNVLGGYTAGCSERLIDPANTILDGNLTNTVLALSAPDVAAEFLVEGLTLRNGNRASGDGGGLYARVGRSGAVAVNRNRIENNTDIGYGGGAYIAATTATLTHNNITGNTANSLTSLGGVGGSGGGAYIAATTATLTHNSITGNTAGGGYGGGGTYI